MVGGFFVYEFVFAFLASCVACTLILFTRKFHGGYSDRRKDMLAVQRAHVKPTPRIGGLAILISFSLLGVFLSDRAGRDLWFLVPSLAPVFFAGLAEDLGFHVSPRNRLIAAAASSVLAIILFDLWIPRTDIPLLGWAFAFAPVAIGITIFGGAGVCNAFNLVDGVNGLSSSIAVVVAASLAAITLENGMPEVAAWCVVLIGALFGFLVFNFPGGKIFMGDAGAYGIGHILAWLAFLSLNFIPDLTPWALLLIFFWPVADTILAIFRRRLAGRPAGQPDRLHFHQLVMRSLETGVLGPNAHHISNPLSTVVLTPMFTAPAIAGVVFWDNPPAAVFSLLAFTVLFVATYHFGMRVSSGLRLPGGRPDQFDGPYFKRLHDKKLGD